MRFSLLLAAILLISPLEAAQQTGALRQWMLQRLSMELAVPHPDLNLVSSFGMPLVTDAIQTGNPHSRKLAAQLGQQLEQWKRRTWQCRELVDLHLVNGFLRRVDAEVDLSASQQQLSACLSGERLLDVANTLIFSCGFAPQPDQALIRDGLNRVLQAQRPDGAFVPDNGKSWYYLTSHALLAMHFCDADRDAVNSSREMIQRLLPAFRRQGYIDGVAETLIFLRWTGKPAEGERDYLDWLRSLVAPDGGVCFRRYPGCAPHWHTVSLMMQLFLEADR